MTKPETRNQLPVSRNFSPPRLPRPRSSPARWGADMYFVEALYATFLALCLAFLSS